MRQLSNNVLFELFEQTSSNPFLTLITLSHASFATLRIVNNSENIISRGDTFLSFPVKITLPTDDGTSEREVQLEMDNAGLDLITEIRSVTTPIDVKLEMILASTPDTVEIAIEELKIRNITYNARSIRGNLYFVDFLNTEMTSEKYTPILFPGIFS